MKRRPDLLAARPHDLLIVGGGITGACLAFDAALRGLDVALIDKSDFGGATSAASSKLLHGGLRHLQQLRLDRARESAAERLRFQNLAPHLTRWVPFVVPTYPGLAKGRFLLASGLATYRVATAGLGAIVRDPAKRPPPGRALSADDVTELIPGVDGERITGGRLFHESHMISSERMTLAFVDSAARAGALVANYLRAERFVVDEGRIVGVQARDREDGARIEVRARAVVNASGPWIRELNSQVAPTVSGIVTGHSRGAHLVTRSLTRDCAVALPTRRAAEAVVDRGGRHVFIIPWRGHSLVGTTYGPHTGPLYDVQPTRAEIVDLIDDVNEALGAGTLTLDAVRYAYAGLYPLLAEEIDPAVYQGSGEYRVVDHDAADGVAGLFSVFGAKYTTARALAESALDRIVSAVGLDAAPCRTRDVALAAGDIPDITAFRAELTERFGGALALSTIEYLVDAHGTAAPRIIELALSDAWLAEPLAEGREAIAAEVIWATREEMARRLEDVVFRRTGLCTLGDPGSTALERAARLMASELGWNERRQRDEIDAVRERLEPAPVLEVPA